jgi:hypothetical protein
MINWRIIISPCEKYSYQEVIIEGPTTQESARQVAEARFPGATINCVMRVR